MSTKWFCEVLSTVMDEAEKQSDSGCQRKVRKTIEKAISRSTSSKMIQKSGIQKGNRSSV